MKGLGRSANLLFLLVAAGLGVVCLTPGRAAALTITPSTWNVVGLDSNTPAFGPNRFPVGARVCGGTAGSTATATFSWDGGGSDDGTYIYLRPGSNSTVEIKYVATVSTDPQYPQACADAFFEVEVKKDSNAFDQTRRYHITADGLTTPTPREIYVEHLVSQARNGITKMEFGESLGSMADVANGGSMDLVKGNTYFIRMTGFTATSGYEQLESFVSFPNTIFQVLAVESDYSADTTTHVANHNPALYGDGCFWENDPNSPNYLACNDGGKIGGTIEITYQVKILSVGTGRESLNSLIHDFSGNSFHYNADYSTSARFANLIDPALVSISKSFFPTLTNTNGVSTLTFTLTNPNPGTVGNLNFSDPFPASLEVAEPPNATTSGCGTPTFAPAAGATSVSFSNGTAPAYGSCTVKVNVKPTASTTYNNVSDHLFVGTVDTGDNASASLTADTTTFPPPSPPSSCTTPTVLARWSMPDTTKPPVATIPAGVDVASATAGFTAAALGGDLISATGSPAANSWGATGWASSPGTTFPSATTAPWFDFTVDTSKYGGARMTANYAKETNGNWNNPNNNRIYVYSGANGATPTLVSTINSSAGSWQTGVNGITANAAATGSSTTTFRINATGSGFNQQTGAPQGTFYLDEIVVSGCSPPKPPAISKAFSPNPVAVGATSTLTFTVTNPNTDSNAAYSFSNYGFTDTLPAGLTVTSGSSTQCGGTLTMTAPNTLAFTGGGGGAGGVGALAAGGTCNITATVTVASDSPGPHDNVSGFVANTVGGIANTNTTASGVATASLMALAPPSIAKEFDANPVLLGNTSTLTFTITNPNVSNGLSGVAFADTFPVAPGAMKVATSPNVATSGCGAGAFSPALVGNETAINFTNGTIAAGGTCTVSVKVATPVAGTYVNTSGNVSHLINAATVNGNTATDSLLVKPVNPAISLIKQIGTSSTGPWSSSLAVQTGSPIYYLLTMENLGDVALSPVGVTDPTVSTAGCSWPVSLPVAVAANDNHIATCVIGPINATTTPGPTTTPPVAPYRNTATASGTYGGMAYTDVDWADYATTGLTISKSATTSYFGSAGSTLNYQYVVANPGFAALSGPATVADDKATATCPPLTTAVLSSDGTTPGDLDNFLDPGEQITCTAAYTVTAADVTAMAITNVASATVGGATSPTATLTVPKGMPSFLMVKSLQTFSDPINDQTSPKAIPGAFVDYTITVTNTGPGEVDAGKTVITDPIPADTELFVGDIDGSGPGSGPLLFTEGATASGLAYTFTSLDSITDNLAFSGDYGVDLYGKADTAPDGNGCDQSVTNIKIPLSGTFNASDGANHPSFSVKFRVRIK